MGEENPSAGEGERHECEAQHVKVIEPRVNVIDPRAKVTDPRHSHSGGVHVNPRVIFRSKHGVFLQ